MPDVLVVHPPTRDRRHASANADHSVRLLTGTFTLPHNAALTPAALALAQRADTLERLLDVVLRALGACETVLRESEKQTMIWREELEECGQQQDMSVADVHADLFRFLVAGRCGPAVSEWVGSRMTNRTVTKWEGSMLAAFSTVQKLVLQSIAPALERVMLVVAELEAWAADTAEVGVLLDEKETTRAVALTRGLLMLVENMRLDAETEYAAADEWCKWLRYGGYPTRSYAVY